ncbi:hypothetical protein [Stenotrophomonas maltophilia]|uniref:hypothetical protein n=1 Tax=Stenotrophomonas maltophilia TaxID=40324 RepID=UPI00313A89FB
MEHTKIRAARQWISARALRGVEIIAGSICIVAVFEVWAVTERTAAITLLLNASVVALVVAWWFNQKRISAQSSVSPATALRLWRPGATAGSLSVVQGVADELRWSLVQVQIEGLEDGLAEVGLGLRTAKAAATSGLNRPLEISAGESACMVRGLMKRRISHIYPLIDDAEVERELDSYASDGFSFKLMSDTVAALETQGFEIYVTDPALNEQCRVSEHTTALAGGADLLRPGPELGQREWPDPDDVANDALKTILGALGDDAEVTQAPGASTLTCEVEAATLRITAVGDPRGELPEMTRVEFVTQGRSVDEDEIQASLAGVEDDTCSVGRYSHETRTGYYTVIDVDPSLDVGQVVEVLPLAQLGDVELRAAYDAGVRARRANADYWPSWWDYQRSAPVAQPRVPTQSSYFHGGYHGLPYSAELAKHPLDRVVVPTSL